MALYGVTYDSNGRPLAGVTVEMKNERFETVLSAISAEDGSYRIETGDGKWPFITAVRDYGTRYLEFWCQDMTLCGDTELNPYIGTLEVYGLHMFRVKGAGKQYLLYFRPMELGRFIAGEKDICPEVEKVCVTIDGEEVTVLGLNRVEEITPELRLGAYLINITAPQTTADWKIWSSVRVKVYDKRGSFGEAVLYND